MLLHRWYQATRPKRNPHPYAFVFVVTLQLKVGMRAAWLKEWSILAKYVKDNEPNTLTYEAVVSEEHPDTVLIYERYVSKVLGNFDICFTLQLVEGREC